MKLLVIFCHARSISIDTALMIVSLCCLPLFFFVPEDSLSTVSSRQHTYLATFHSQAWRFLVQAAESQRHFLYTVDANNTHLDFRFIILKCILYRKNCNIGTSLCSTPMKATESIKGLEQSFRSGFHHQDCEPNFSKKVYLQGAGYFHTLASKEDIPNKSPFITRIPLNEVSGIGV